MNRVTYAILFINNNNNYNIKTIRMKARGSSCAVGSGCPPKFFSTFYTRWINKQAFFLYRRHDDADITIASSSSPPKALHLVLMSALIYDFPCSLYLSNKIARSSPQLSSSTHPMTCHIFRQRNFSFD